MDDVYFSLEWNNLLNKSNSEVKSFEQELKEASVKYPSKNDIQLYYSDQINMLHESIIKLGFPLNQNLLSSREKLMELYKASHKKNIAEIESIDDLKKLAYYKNLILLGEGIIVSINNIEDQLNESEYGQNQINESLNSLQKLNKDNLIRVKGVNPDVTDVDYLLEATINSWVDTLESVFDRISIEIINQGLKKEPVVIRSMVVHDDLSFDIHEEIRYYDLSLFRNLVDSILTEIQNEIINIKKSYQLDQRFEVINFLNEHNVQTLIEQRGKLNALIEHYDIRLLNKKRTVTFEEKIKDKDRLNLIIIELIKKNLLSEEDGTYLWNGINNKNIESLAAFAIVLEKEKVMGCFTTGKSAFEAYSSIFNNSTDTADYFTRFYNKPQEVFDLEQEFSFIKNIK